ncbi:MAG: class I SAM-dependent methyltransferase [Phycisphaerales bacterium]|nr:class I SAM-dependent methyltransferase [Phycisphaerales bacterium]
MPPTPHPPPPPPNEHSRLTKNVEETRNSHSQSRYFANAEQYMDVQWRAKIEPRIRDGDFSSTLDLACGHGRNAAKLLPMCKELWLVDVNDHCIEACRKRFVDAQTVAIHYHVNDGCSLSFIPDGRLTFVYSWDAMVHFDTLVVERYIHEFARVMAPGARGFIHHSNYGAAHPDSNWLDNPHWRSNTSRDDVARYMTAAGLEIVSQELMPWGHDADLDCLTRFRKPG